MSSSSQPQPPHDWAALPPLCLQVLSGHLQPLTHEATAARLVCRSWAAALPLPRLSIRLGVDGSASVQPSQQLRRLLEMMQQQEGTSALRGAPALVLTLADSRAPAAAVGPSNECAAAPASSSGLVLAAELAATLQHLQSVTISVDQGWRLRPAHCQDGAFSALLQLVAALQQQPRLRSLTLSCSSRWSAPQGLAAALQRLPGLAALQLQHCPVAALAQLPSLPRLQRLAVSGRPHEPVPPSYSVKQRPLLPHLPGLTSLALAAMPVDLVTQEAEGIRAWQQQQQRQAGATAATSSPRWRSQRQWVSASIAAACPALQVAASSVPLCKPLLSQILCSLSVLACPEVVAHELHAGGAHRRRLGCAHTHTAPCMQRGRLAVA